MLDRGARFHQVSYVTTDLDQALAVYARDYGLPRFYRVPVIATGLPIKVAIAVMGGVEIELIEPAPGQAAAIFADPLPRDGRFAIQFHHMAVRVTGSLEDWEAYRRNLDLATHPIAYQGAVEDRLRFVYTDERPRLGHYVEHVWMSPPLLEQMSMLIPNYPAAD